MKRQMPGLLAAAAGMVLSAPIAASTSAPFDAALAVRDYIGAAKEVDRLAETKVTKATLDIYYGRLLVTSDNPLVAEPYLLRAVANARDGADKDLLLFELAHMHEVTGFVAKAEADYRRLAAVSVTPSIRQDATLALARLSLGAAPDEAVALLAPLAGRTAPPSARWEALLLLSRAHALLGHAAESKAALAAAWQEAPQAPSPASAIAVTAMDMAVDHAAAGQRGREVGLVPIGGTNSHFAGVAQLPTCGGALRPDDTVTVAITADSRQGLVYSAVRASRPGIAQLFTIPLAAAAQHLDDPALYVTLRCRTQPDAAARPSGEAPRDLSRWLAERGDHPPVSPIYGAEGNPLASLGNRLARLERRVGADSPALLPTLLQAAVLYAAQGRYGSTEAWTSARAVVERALRILAAADAPPELVTQVQLQTTRLLSNDQSVSAMAGPAALEALSAVLARPETSPALALATFSEMSGWQLRPAQKLVLADRLFHFLDTRAVGAADPVRQVAELRRASILRDLGTVAGMHDRLVAGGIAGDTCNAADRAPIIPMATLALTDDDYPKDLLQGKITGTTTIELAVDAAGAIVQRRMIVSQPPGLFDAVTADKLGAVTLLPAQRGGRPVACNGMTQTVRWKMPYEGDFASPVAGFPYAPE